VEVGLATVYDAKLEGQLTASGEPYRSEDLTAAHRSHPLGTRLRVIAVRSGKTATVRVNDRWGGGPGRVINLSARAARELGFGAARTVEVRIEVEALGTGRPAQRQAPAPPASIAAGTAAASRPASRIEECAEQAKILGLQAEWAERHIRACLANRPKK
jgi:rare lipoprotein A